MRLISGYPVKPTSKTLIHTSNLHYIHKARERGLDSSWGILCNQYSKCFVRKEELLRKKHLLHNEASFWHSKKYSENVKLHFKHTYGKTFLTMASLNLDAYSSCPSSWKLANPQHSISFVHSPSKLFTQLILQVKCSIFQSHIHCRAVTI